MQIGKCDFKQIRKQIVFCNELMQRLYEEILHSGEGSWSGMEYHERKRDDIKRLRRELMELSKMLNPWRSGNE